MFAVARRTPLLVPSSKRLAAQYLHGIYSTTRPSRTRRYPQNVVAPPMRREMTTATPRFTASTAFLEALWEGGVEACFVNLGSDHTGLIEAILKAQRDRKDKFPKIYTCPSEMVAMSMADGWARVTGRPQAVIVHVDVGTQALGCALHNASCGRAPVLVFAGLCPFTEDGELPGSRTEYQHWIQDALDQKSIVNQYCRYVGDLRTGRTVKQTVARALQFATSDPKGPVYLAGAREIMAEAIEPYEIDQEKYSPIEPAALPAKAVSDIAEALVNARNPLIITGYSGRNHANPSQLVQMADTVPGLRVFDTGGSDMCFPSTHRASLGFRFSFHEATTEADLILIIDCDVPWIPSRNPPREDARIYHIDADPLNCMMSNSHFPAHGRWKVDSYTALTQLNTCLQDNLGLVETLKHPVYVQRGQLLADQHATRLASFAELAAPRDDGTITAHHVGAAIKSSVPADTVFVIEAVTCAIQISDQLQTSMPGSWINCGGAGLGWGGGAALGVRLALEARGRPKFVCAIVGDGAFLFGVPGSVYWIAARYGIPVLTVVLNNKGWNAPRKSLELVHPTSLASTSSNKDLHISFEPSPDYSGIAKAASGRSFGGLKEGLFAGRAENGQELKALLAQAVTAVKEGRGAVVEAVLDDEDVESVEGVVKEVALQEKEAEGE